MGTHLLVGLNNNNNIVHDMELIKYINLQICIFLSSTENLVIWLVVTSLSTSSHVYHVIPDGHYPTSDDTYTLQHYLNNTLMCNYTSCQDNISLTAI